ncbi:hypothetical protein F4821DRAFT_113483 [Hypoxylon rubiginosum]|uniref:Uncharacterized protein n=1 Tax=Hypoxylon rubiginosum TaxID=110542 RepID=A0ACC0DKQ5_9PEZI|nr:hypothetical protein F4821DRAFT_113483 [Hypoxylon rubiginosum]
MQFKAITTLFALAAVAIAAPSEVVARTGGEGGSCSNSSQNQVCCTALTCIVQLLSPTCTSQAYCCDTGDAPDNGLVVIDVTALNCVKVQ